MPPATPLRNAPVAPVSARTGSSCLAGLRRLGTTAAAGTMTAAASAPPGMTATARRVTMGGMMTVRVGEACRRACRAQSTAITSSAVDESAVHQDRVETATAAKEPAETSTGMLSVDRRAAAAGCEPRVPRTAGGGGG
jgi:hypothetical protein